MSNQRPRLDLLLLETVRLADQVVNAWPERRRPKPGRPEKEIGACVDHVRMHRAALICACVPDGLWNKGTPQRTVLRSLELLVTSDDPPTRARFLYLARAARSLAARQGSRRSAAPTV